MKVTLTSASWREDNARRPACAEETAPPLAARLGRQPTPACSAVLSMSVTSLYAKPIAIGVLTREHERVGRGPRGMQTQICGVSYPI